jgi:hypothetical protein
MSKKATTTKPVLRGKENLKKHVGAIHTSGDLSYIARKVSNVLLYQAYDNLLTKERHSIPLRLLADLVGWSDSNDYERLKDAVRELNATRVEFNLMEDGEEVWETSSLIAWAQIRKQSGSVEWEYTREMAKRLYEPTVFARINLGIQREIGSGYALALYENIARYRNVKFTGDLEIEKIRYLIGATAPTYDEYKRFSAFVLKPSIEQINKSTDILVTPHYKKKGRKVLAINFEIAENPQKQLPNAKHEGEASIKKEPEYQRLIEEGANERLAIVEVATKQQIHDQLPAATSPDQRKIIDRLDAHGLGETDAFNLIAQYGEPRVLAVIEHVEGEDKLGKVKNSGALIITILKRKGAVGKTVAQQRKEAEKRQVQQRVQQEIINDEVASKQVAAENTALWDAFLAMPKEEQQSFIDPIIARDRFALKSYQDKGLSSAILHGLLLTELKKAREAGEGGMGQAT